MGFWSPQTLVADARRHGVEVRRADVDRSSAQATLEEGARAGAGPAVRLGLEYVRTIGLEMAERIAAGRPYADMEDLVRRTSVSRAQLEALATAGALAGSGGRPGGGAKHSRREGLGAAGAVSPATPAR